MARRSYIQLSEQLEGAIETQIMSEVLKAAVPIRKKCRAMLEDFIKNVNGFHHVTGNTINGLAVAAYYNGVFLTAFTAEELIQKPPTRETLKAGEEYDQSKYYSGMRARRYLGRDSSGRVKTSSPYRGTQGENNYDIPARVRDMITSSNISRTTFKSGLSFIVISGSNITEFLEKREGVALIQNYRNIMASNGKIRLTEILKHRL